MNIRWKSVLKSVVPVVLASGIGGLFMAFSKLDYKSLKKPPFSPPGFLFPIIWSILYILIAVSCYIYDGKSIDNKEDNTRGIVIYYIDMFINGFWTFFYFYLNLKIFAAIWLGVLYLVVSSRYIAFNKHSKLAANLNIPYLVWLLVALYLNIGTILLN